MESVEITSSKQIRKLFSKIRSKNKLSQKEIAKHLDLTESAAKMLEYHYDQRLSIDNFHKWITAFNNNYPKLKIKVSCGEEIINNSKSYYRLFCNKLESELLDVSRTAYSMRIGDENYAKNLRRCCISIDRMLMGFKDLELKIYLHYENP